MEPRPWHAAYDPDVPATIDFADVPGPERLRRAAVAHPNAVALRFVNLALDYRTLAERTERCAAGLAGLGVGPGTRVAIQLPNLPQTVVAYHAVLSLGAVVVMTNPLYVERELEHQWNDAGCEVAITADYLWKSRIEPIRDRLPVRTWVIASIPEALPWSTRWLAALKLRRADPPLVADFQEGPGVVRFPRLLASASGPAPRPTLRLDDPAALQYTGGTTGLAKGAVLTHRNLARQTEQLLAWLPALEPGREVFLGALPFFHVFGLTVALNLAVATAAEMVLIPNPRDVGRMIAAINRRGVTIFPVVPAMISGISAHPKAKTLRVDTLKLCVSGSAPLADVTLERFEAITGGRIVEGYGLTEASPVTHVNPARGERRVGWIGLPLPETDARVLSLDGSGTEVAPGETGELAIRGPQVMAGYWNRPEDTASTVRDGWLLTGDLAVRDEAGWFRIVGRKKEMIVASGYNVYPDEVDGVLASHPAVLECATIGLPDERRGELVVSYVVLRPGTTVTEAELRDFCREGLAAYKVPRRIELRDSLPKSSVLKILRRELRDEALRALGGSGGSGRGEGA